MGLRHATQQPDIGVVGRVEKQRRWGAVEVRDAGFHEAATWLFGLGVRESISIRSWLILVEK
jgi:hypothetical protein